MIPFYKTFLLVLLISSYLPVFSQNVGIGTNSPHPSAKLHIQDNNRGILIPRISIPDVSTAAPVTTPAAGLLVFNTSTTTVGGSGSGFYYWSGTQWIMLKTGANTLDMAYDQGGPGLGRSIIADAGTVEISGNGGLWVNANNPTQLSAIQTDNSNGSMSTAVDIGYLSTLSGNNQLQGIRSINNYNTSAINNFDGSFGVYGSTGRTGGGTINLNTTANSNNKAVGIAGGLGSTTSYTGSAGDVIAAVAGFTGHHNAGGGTITGSRLYAGLFAGNGRTLGLWGENSTYMELIPNRQSGNYDAAVVGFYNPSANGGNNGGNIATGDTYFSLEANVTDATLKHMTLQTRTNGNVGIGTASPTEKLHVNGGTRISSLAGAGNRIVKTDANGVLSAVTTTGGTGEVLTSDGVGGYYWQSPVGQAWNISGNAGTNPVNNFLGTTDNQDLVFRTNNSENMRINTDGNVGIGTQSSLARLYVNLPSSNTATRFGVYNLNDGASTSTTYALYNLNYSATNATKYGIYNNVNSEGTGNHYGIYNLTYMNTASNLNAYGGYNFLSAYGTGNHRANYNNLLVNGTVFSTQNFASYNRVAVSNYTNTSNLYGEFNEVGYSAGTSYGEYKEMNTNATYNSLAYGDYNEFIGTGSGDCYGMYNDFALTGNGTKFGVYNFWPDVQGTKYGMYNNMVSGTQAGTIYGVFNNIAADGLSVKYGVYNYIDGGLGPLRASYNRVFAYPNNGGTIHGVYSYISSNGSGVHYGLYSSAAGGTNDYAAMLHAGNVVANEIGGNYDFRIEGDTDISLFMVDASSDNVGVGNIAPTYKLDVNHPSAANPTLVYRGRNADAVGTRTQIGSVEYFQDQVSTIDYTGGSNFSINLNAAAAYDLQLAFNSAAKPGSSTWTVVSDKRLKEDIAPFKDGLSTLRSIKPVYYKYNGNANIKDEHYFVGVLAQDLEPVAPYMVGSFETASGALSIQKQEATKSTYKTVDANAMTYIAINAIKELDDQQKKERDVFKNISDFGLATSTGIETYVPFNNDFSSNLEGTAVITVTPINQEAVFTIVSQSNKGFTVKCSNEADAVNFNWMAMARVKQQALVADKNYTEEERHIMLSKIKAAQETINFESEYDEIEQRQREKMVKDALIKVQNELGAVAAAAENPDEEAENDRKKAAELSKQNLIESKKRKDARVASRKQLEKHPE